VSVWARSVLQISDLQVVPGNKAAFYSTTYQEFGRQYMGQITQTWPPLSAIWHIRSWIRPSTTEQSRFTAVLTLIRRQCMGQTTQT